jgi:hypothetical protein
MFPSEIPAGVPPIRGIEHQIDLIQGASLPNRAIQDQSGRNKRDSATSARTT